MSLKANKSSSLELKKHVNAIHCTNNLTLVQRKLFNALLFNAYPQLSQKNCFQIQTRELCRLIGYNSNDYASIKQALLGLITIAIEWNVIDCTTGKESKWKASAILSSAELAGGICNYEYSHIMKELLFQPEIYGRINIELMAKFKSSYGLALYENCIRYQGLPQTPWFTLEIFRKLMGVLGDKYSAFKDFKKRVLNMAVEEVNSICPIMILPEIERKNKQVFRIRFKLNNNQLDIPNNINSSISFDKDLLSLLAETFHLSPKSIENMLTQYEPSYIKGKIELILHSSSFISGKIRDLAGYLLQALKQDFQPSKSSQMILAENKKKKAKIFQEKENQKENLRERYINYINTKIETYLNKLSTAQYNNLIEEFSKQIENENSIIKNWYSKKHLNHPGIKAFFNKYIIENKSCELGNLLSYEHFADVFEEISI